MTGETKRLAVSEIEPVSSDDAQGDANAGLGRTSDSYTDAEWSEAQRRLAVIKPLADHEYPSRAQIQAAAKAAGVSESTIYRYRSAYAHSGHISSLVPRPEGRPVGMKMVPPEVEAIITASIEDTFLITQKLTCGDVVAMVRERCRTAKLKPPAENTVRSRIAELHPALVLRRRGERAKARDKYAPIRGAFPNAEVPLAVVQIDHTQLDVIVVEETTRKPMGRPWLTLAIDVYSRMVTGLYISMERPNANAVGLCLSMAMLTKTDYLRRLEVPGQWPVYGPPKKILCDNAKEFRGRMLVRACEAWGIDHEFRPIRLPHYGGHIERLMGTTANEIRKLDGATFSNPQQRGSYNSEKAATMTLGEVERYFVDFLVTGYHERFHKGIQCSPKERWRIGIQGDGVTPGTGLPEKIADPTRLRLDFMPAETRSIQPYGVILDGVHYYDEVLNRWIGVKSAESAKAPRQFTFRRDPRDISQIWFFEPDLGRYFPIPYRNVTRPAVSLWEVRTAKAELLKEGKTRVDEKTLFDGIARRREIVEDARHKTKSARREHHRATRHLPPSTDVPPVVETVPRPSQKRLPSVEDLFAEPAPVFGVRANKMGR